MITIFEVLAKGEVVGVREFSSKIEGIAKNQQVKREDQENTVLAVSLSEIHKTTAERETSVKALDFSKVGRNDPCPCDSGLKYKKCHGR